MGPLKRLWAWIRRVIADRGEHVPIPIDLERTAGGGYVFRLGVRAGFGGQETARIPISVRINPANHPVLKEIHSCEVAGRTLEAANVYALREKVARQLEGIAPSRTLPLCFFRAPAMEYEIPVYEEDGAIRTPIAGGPNLKARDIASIRRQVCRHLVTAGYASDPEEVVVGVLRPRDLRRVPPAAVFRSTADPDVWIASVEGISAEGPVVGVLGHGARLRRAERRRTGAGPAISDQAPAAPDVLSLLRFLRVELARNGDLAEPDALYAAAVRPEIWADAQQRTEDAGLRLHVHMEDAETLELAVRRTGAGDLAVAFEDRGINVFVAHDPDALASAVAAHMTAHDFVRFAGDVEVRPVAARRAERLEADTIWTFGDGDSVAATTTSEEVSAT